ATRRILRVDRDNLDEILGRLGAKLSLTLPGGESTPISLTFHEVDDFHPDRILAPAEGFASLRSILSRLENPATFAAAAAELMASPPEPEGTTSTSERAPDLSPGAPPADLLDQILQQSSPTAAAAPPSSRQTSAWGKFLEQITSPHIQHENP